MKSNISPSQSLAENITRTASKQTYYTIRFFADRDLRADAYRAYAYFRWVDDCLDEDSLEITERTEFIARQQALLDACYQGHEPVIACEEESMLVDLIHNHPASGSGIEIYLRNMMAVMVFDHERRGRMISQTELSEYSWLLATAVTEALHYFIGHNDPSPQGEARYLAVQGAHIIHMLRDYQEDLQAGYFNIPDEYLQEYGLERDDMENPYFQKWVQARIQLAAACFRQGRETISQVKNMRCRLAGYAYVARFEWMLRAIERDNYHLRPAYPERKSLRAGAWVFLRAVYTALNLDRLFARPRLWRDRLPAPQIASGNVSLSTHCSDTTAQ